MTRCIYLEFCFFLNFVYAFREGMERVSEREQNRSAHTNSFTEQESNYLAQF